MLLLLVISLLLLIIVFLLFLSFPQSLAESFALVASTIDKVILPKSEDRCGIFAIQKSFGKNITVISESNAPNPDPLLRGEVPVLATLAPSQTVRNTLSNSLRYWGSEEAEIEFYVSNLISKITKNEN